MLLLNAFVFLSYSVTNNEDFLMLFSSVDTNSDIEMCASFPTQGFIYSQKELTYVNWTLPSGCYGKNTSIINDDNHSSTVEFQCSEPNTPYEFIIEAEDIDKKILNRTITLQFVKCSGFHWYGYVKHSNNTGRQILNGSELLIWPISVAESTESENLHTANLPSDVSIQYALSMNNTLVSPEISLLSPEGTSVNYVWNENTFFNSEMKCWTTTLFFNEWNDFNVQISSHDRYQANEPIRVSHEYFCLSTVDFKSVFQSEYFNATLITGEYQLENISNLHIYRHPCVQSTAFVRSGSYILTTIDDFDSIDVFEINETEINISSMILTTSGISWISEGTAYELGYRSNVTTFSYLDETVNFIKTLFSCNTLTNTKNIVEVNKIIVAANQGSPTKCFYYTTDGWNSFTKIDFDESITLVDMEVVTSADGVIVFYYTKSDNENYTRTFRFENHIDGTFNGTFGAEYSFADSGLDKADLTEKCFLTSNSIGQIFFVGKEIFVSTDTATTFLPLRLISFDESFNLNDENDNDDGNQYNSHKIVRDIAFSRSCKCAVIYQTGEIFILYPNQNFFVQIQPLGGKNSYLRFDNLERISLLNFRTEMNNSTRLKYPLLINSEIDVFQYIYKDKINIDCPYIAFDVDYPINGLAYIDKKTVVNTLTTIITEEKAIDPLVRATGEVAISYGQKTLKSAIFDSDKSTYKLLKKVETEINLTSVREGYSYLFVSPSSATYNCRDSTRILNVFVGCPKGRNVRLKGGNDISLFYSKTQFKPELELYDYDKYVQDVDGDFAVYMVNRTKSTKIMYCQTAKSVGCIKRPQKWSDFIKTNTSWNHSNYENCFIGEPQPYEDDEYNIMNKTDQSCIVLMPKNRKYTFVATVLDPNFSYCFLSTEFTVNVYGETMPFYYSLVIVAGVIFLCAIGIAITHVYLESNFKKSDKKIE